SVLVFLARRRGLRQIDGERGAVSEHALDVDIAVGLLGKTESLAEPEARAFADFLGGEEWLEDRSEVFRAGFGPLVVYGNREQIPITGSLCSDRRDRLDLSDRYRQAAFIGHGVARVDGEVEQRRLELRDVG